MSIETWSLARCGNIFISRTPYDFSHFHTSMQQLNFAHWARWTNWQTRMRPGVCPRGPSHSLLRRLSYWSSPQARLNEQAPPDRFSVRLRFIGGDVISRHSSFCYQETPISDWFHTDRQSLRLYHKLYCRFELYPALKRTRAYRVGEIRYDYSIIWIVFKTFFRDICLNKIRKKFCAL